MSKNLELLPDCFKGLKEVSQEEFTDWQKRYQKIVHNSEFEEINNPDSFYPDSALIIMHVYVNLGVVGVIKEEKFYIYKFVLLLTEALENMGLEAIFHLEGIRLAAEAINRNYGG